MILDVNDVLAKMAELDGFDLDLAGFNCEAELDWDSSPLVCPFKPGCGLPVKDCPLRKRLALVSRAPARRQ